MNTGFVICCILQGIYGILSMCFAVVLNVVANTAGDAKSIHSLFAAGGLAVAFGLLYPASRALADSVTQAYGERAAQKLRSRICQAIFSMDSAGFSSEDTGDYLNRLTGDVLMIRDQYMTQVPLLFSYGAQFIFCVIYSFMLNPVVGGILMVMSAVQYVVPMMFGKTLDRRTVAQSKETGNFTSKAKELLLGFGVIRSYGAWKQAGEAFDQAGKVMAKARRDAAVMSQIMMCTNMAVALMIILASVLTAGYFVLQGQMSPATLLTVFYIANRYSMPVMDFSRAYTQIKGSRGVRAKVEAFLKDHPVTEPGQSRPVEQGISIFHLSFSYHPGEEILHDISFDFQMGKKYLLIGESGCGKSTLLKVMAGLYPARGIFIDGKKMEDLPSGSLAGRMILVGQQPYIFSRSVAENIDFLKTGDRDRLMKVIRDCCLTDLIESLPQGADTVVDEEQRQLSGGQKARIGLARAVYAGPDILFLDEVTSALDPDTALKIEEMILDLENVLVIHISHKPAKALMHRYDRILEMRDGYIISSDLGL